MLILFCWHRPIFCASNNKLLNDVSFSPNFPSLPPSGHPSGQETAALGVGPRGRPAVPFLANRAAPGLSFFSNLLSFRQLGAFLGAAVSPLSGQQLALMMNHRRTPNSLALGMPPRDSSPTSQNQRHLVLLKIPHLIWGQDLRHFRHYFFFCECVSGIRWHSWPILV